jgi:hypothetical protein
MTRQDDAAPFDERLFRLHLAVLGAGFLAGMTAAYAFTAIPFDFSGEIVQARELGVVSRTILDGYPKTRDLLNYGAILGFPVLFAVGGWLFWSRGERRRSLAAMLAVGLPPKGKTTGWRVILAITGISCIAITLLCFRSAAYSNLVSLTPWLFLGEEGENLAWAQSILNGGVYGRDIHCLYGPMLIYPLVGFMKLAGTTVATLRLYTFLLNLAAYGIILAFLYKTLRAKTVFALAVPVYLWIFPPLTVLTPNGSYLRVVLGLLPILLTYLYMERGGRWMAFAIGLALGQSVLFSQEAGVCSALAVITMFSVARLPERDFRTFLHEAGLVLAGWAASVAPTVGYFASKGVLGEVFDNLFVHARLLGLGFTALPFPDFAEFLHAPLSGKGSYFYWMIFVYILSALYLIPQAILQRRDRDIVLRLALLVFGAFLYRSVLARSDVSHATFASPPAVLLLVLFLDGALSGWKRHTGGTMMAVRLAVILGVLATLAIASVRNSYFHLWSGARPSLERLGKDWLTVDYGLEMPQIPRSGVSFGPRTAATIAKLHDFLEKNTAPGEFVYFFPNEAAYYFLFDRNNPTRYVFSIFAATRDQRLELIGDLERKRPRFVIYSLKTVRLDGIHESVQMPEIVDYLGENYRLLGESDDYLILERAGK